MQKYTFSRIKTSHHHTFSRILLPKSYTFSRITPCTLCWIQKVHPTKIHHPPIKYPTNIAIFAHNKVSKKDFIQGKQNRDFGYIESTKKHGIAAFNTKPKLEPLFHQEFSAKTESRATRKQHLNHRSAKALILNSRLKLHRIF